MVALQFQMLGQYHEERRKKMELIITVKHQVLLLEKDNNWNQIIDYLYEQWLQRMEDGDLCILLVQQLIEYLLLIDTPPVPLNDSNYSEESQQKFQKILNEAVRYGMTHCLGNKYFLWQICEYLSGISTYYFFYGSLLRNEDSALNLLKKLLETAKETFPDSVLFDQFHEYLHGNDNWQRPMSAEKKKQLLNEVNCLQLQGNMADQNVYCYLVSGLEQ